MAQNLNCRTTATTGNTAVGTTLSHAQLDSNFNQLATSAGVQFNNFGVGVANSGTAGTILASSNITAYSSDERLKTNFTPISNAIQKLMQIGGYEFDWIADKCAELDFNYANLHEHGLKAQQVQKIIPDAVHRAPFDFDRDAPNNSRTGECYLTVDYARLVPLLVEAIKEQQTIIESQELRLAALEQKISKILE